MCFAFGTDLKAQPWLKFILQKHTKINEIHTFTGLGGGESESESSTASGSRPPTFVIAMEGILRWLVVAGAARPRVDAGAAEAAAAAVAAFAAAAFALALPPRPRGALARFGALP